MSKTSLVESIAATTDISKSTIAKVLDALPEALSAEIVANGRTVIPGVCSIAKKDRPARTGRNPATGQPLEIAAKSVNKFTPNGVFKV